VVFSVGAVLDDAARADLEPVLAVLTRPDAAPVLLTGSAEPGVDDASALRLAQQRADAVAAALVEAGAPASLLRTTAVVDPGAARSVVLASEVP
jgi:outer membrane protein OmpA-like peptidoglycan-associated protein